MRPTRPGHRVAGATVAHPTAPAQPAFRWRLLLALLAAVIPALAVTALSAKTSTPLTGALEPAQAPVAAATAASAAADAPLPEAPGVEIARARCLSCHGGDIIAGQRLSAAGWDREIDKMIRWGARVPDTERAGLHAYLSSHFGVRPSANLRASESATDPIGNPADRAAQVYRRACLSCHGEDLVASQRLTLAGWTREVAKMRNWGARLDDDEARILAAFLAERHPVTPAAQRQR